MNPQAMPVTRADIERVIKFLGETVGHERNRTNALVDPLIEITASRLDAIEKRIAKIETKGVQYRGVYQRSDEYTRGDLVTHEGSMWHCCADTTRTVPASGNDWQLAVKRGVDAR